MKDFISKVGSVLERFFETNFGIGVLSLFLLVSGLLFILLGWLGILYIKKEWKAQRLLYRYTKKFAFSYLDAVGGLSGARYRIYRFPSANEGFTVRIKDVCSFCTFLQDPGEKYDPRNIPDSDRMLSFYLYIKYDERRFLTNANPRNWTETGHYQEYPKICKIVFGGHRPAPDLRP